MVSQGMFLNHSTVKFETSKFLGFDGYDDRFENVSVTDVLCFVVHRFTFVLLEHFKFILGFPNMDN